MRALREAHNFSNGVHTLRQDEALHGFVTLGSRLAISSTVDKLQRLAYDALEAESEIFEIREAMQVSPGPEWEPRFARNYIQRIP